MKKTKKQLVSKRARQNMNEVLVEGAASMSGQRNKELAKSLIEGALMPQTKPSTKLRRKVQRKKFTDSLKGKKQNAQKPKKELKENITVEPVIYGGYDYKNSGFKMKGFSGFGNSPAKKTKGHGKHPTHGDMSEGMTGAEFETKKERQGRIDEYTRTPSVAETLRKRKGQKKRQRPLSILDRLLGKLKK
tara:strand:- start:34 stop:600 length:567 start_codon:yes stop_codon:yes gene_type:complete